ncbi:MAG: ABC transporter permease subunit [Pseudanabaenaceae cyanobacterium bins.68]|nr:ABC transporter permease subunit [Pseudanabaenaceae cyanobacterium bins.68]
MKIKNWAKWRSWGLQVGVAIALILLLGWGGHNLGQNLRRANLSLDFGFLGSQSGQVVRDAAFPVKPTDPYAWVIGAGVVNSLKVAGLSMAVGTGLGVVIALTQLSPSWWLRRLAQIYVEALRNLPLLLQLLFWYGVIFLSLPRDQVYEWAGLQLSIQGLAGAGWQWSAEFCTLVLGLSLYGGALMGEVWRGAILAIPPGQWWAAKAAGLAGWQVMVWVILPQAILRVIPPLINQYVNILKNSSLAIAIGYEDLMALSSTALNQTGRAVEIMSLTMGIYLGLCLAIATSMNYLNSSLRRNIGL